jgi:CheY-like chemotaxis protein
MVAGTACAMRILVVDDDKDTVDSSEIMWRLEGHEVQTATDGQRALAWATAFRPELVLLDLAMPTVDGFEVARLIRQLNLEPSPYLVAVTGLVRPVDVRHCAEAGFDLHLPKPLDPAVFRDLPVLLHTSRRATERTELLLVQNRLVTTELIFRQLEMANLCLDSAAITRSDANKTRYLCRARQAYELAASWLSRGACVNDRLRVAIEVSSRLRARLEAAK